VRPVVWRLAAGVCPWLCCRRCRRLDPRGPWWLGAAPHEARQGRMAPQPLLQVVARIGRQPVGRRPPPATSQGPPSQLPPCVILRACVRACVCKAVDAVLSGVCSASGAAQARPLDVLLLPACSAAGSTIMFRQAWGSQLVVLAGAGCNRQRRGWGFEVPSVLKHVLKHEAWHVKEADSVAGSSIDGDIADVNLPSEQSAGQSNCSMAATEQPCLGPFWQCRFVCNKRSYNLPRVESRQTRPA
jgi:hypothetical protein